MANLIQIEIRANDAASSIVKGVSQSLGDIGTQLIGVGSALTLATAPIAAFLGTALKQASDQQTAMAQLESVIRSTGGAAGVTSEAALDLADSLSKVTRFSDDAILSAENLLLTFTQIGKDIFPDVTRIALDMSTALGQDLQSSVMQLGKALNDPISGLTALRRVGVQFTDAQQEMIEAMVTSGDLMGAQRAILAELTKEFGGSAEAAGNTFAGKLDILKNKFGELQEKIGFIVMPVLERLIDGFDSVIDRVTEWANTNPALTRVLVMFGAALVTIGPALIIVGTGMKLLSTVASGLSLALGVLPAVLAAITSPIALIVGGLALLATVLGVDLLGGFQEIGNQVTRFMDMVGDHGLLGAIRLLFVTFEDGSSSLSALFEGFGMAREQAESLATGINEMVQSAVQSFQQFVAGFQVNIGLIPFYAEYAFNKVATAVETYIVDPLRGIWRLVEPHVEAIATWFATDFLDALIAVDNWVYSYVTKPLQKVYEDVEPYLMLLESVFNVVMNNIVTFIQPVVEAVERFVAQISALYQLLQTLGGMEMPKGPEVKPPTNPGGFPTLTESEADYWARVGTPKYAGGKSPYKDFGGRGVAGQAVMIGTGAQPEVYIPDSPGTFYPRGEGMPGAGGGMTVNLEPGSVVVYESNDPEKTRIAVLQAIKDLRPHG